MKLVDLINNYNSSGGTVPSNELQTVANAAWSYLHHHTMGRIVNHCGCFPAPDPVDMCFAELVDTIYQRHNKRIVASRSVDSWSESYVDPAGGKTTDQVCAGIIRRWLSGTDLLYRGCP